MKFKRTKAINKILAMDKRIRIVPGGTSAGKTYAIIPIIIDYAAKNPSRTITVVASTIPSVKRGAMKIFVDTMTETNRWNRKRWHATDRRYTFGNGTTIEFTSFDNAHTAHEAGKRSMLFINECNGVPWQIADTLIARTVEDESIVYLDYNPSEEFWVDTEIMSMESSEVCLLTYLDNDALPKHALEYLMHRKDLAEKEEKENRQSNKHRNWWNVYGLGKKGKIEGLCFPDIEVVDSIPREAQLLGYGMDFGYSTTPGADPNTLVAMYKQGNKLFLDELLYRGGIRHKEIFDTAKSERIDFDAPTICDNDDSKRDELRFFDNVIYWNIICTKKTHNIVPATINLLNEYDLHLTRRSVNGLRESKALKWDKTKEGVPMNKPVPGNDHFWDAARYIGQYALPNKYQY